MHFAPFITNLRNFQAVQRCPHVFGQKPLHDPFYENPVNRKESIAIHQVLGGIGRESLVCIQAIGNMSGKFVIPASVQDVVHQVVHKGNNIPGLIGDESLPRFRKFGLHILCRIGDEHSHDQLFQRRLDIRIAKMLLAEFPEIIQQPVFLYLGQEFIICKLAVCQHNPDHFFKGTGTGTANGRQKARDDVLFVEVFDFKVIETLRPLLVGKELDMLFDDGLVLLVNSQIDRKQRSTVGQKALGVKQRVLQMVVPHIRLWEGRIDEIVCCGVLPFQKQLGRKLVVRLQIVDLGIFQFHILHILHKLAVVIVPKDEFTGITGKLRIQTVYDLFDVHFCHAAYSFWPVTTHEPFLLVPSRRSFPLF